LPLDSYQVSDNTLCLPGFVVCDALQTLASSRTFPGFARIHVTANLFAPAASRQGDRLPQSAAELAAYTSGNFVLQALLPDRQPFTHWLPGTLRCETCPPNRSLSRERWC
jgi:hypothetical protein